MSLFFVSFVVFRSVFSVKGFSRNGLFYSFENRPVLRKFQSQKRDRTILPIRVELYKKEGLNLTREDFQTRTSFSTGSQESVVFAQFEAKFKSPFDRVSFSSNTISDGFSSESLIIDSSSDSPSSSSAESPIDRSVDLSPDSLIPTNTAFRGETIFYLQAEFKNPHFLFLDLIPKKEIFLPYWAESLDFWVQNEHEELILFFYFEYANGSKVRYPLVVQTRKYWRKLYLNFYAESNSNSSKRNSPKKPIRLTQIRLAKPNKKQKPDPFFTVFFTQPQAYSYTKSLKNLYIDPQRSFENFEQTSDWNLQLLNESLLKKSIETDSKRDSKNPRGNLLSHGSSSSNHYKNQRYLSVKVPKEDHQSQDLILRFPDGKHFLKQGEGLSFWARGGSGESISAILEDANQDLIEWKLADLYFSDWRKFQVKLPRHSELKKESFRYWIDPSSRKPYLYLLALRLSPPVSKQDMNLSLDEIQSFDTSK